MQLVAFLFCILQVMILVSCDVKSQLASGVYAYYNGSYYDQEHRRILVYTCAALGDVGDALSWYHVTGSESREISSRVPHTNTASNEMNSTLTLILSEEFNNTRIYCAKTSKGQTSWTPSATILIFFQGASEPQTQNEFITVTPATGVMLFDDNTTLKFVCRESVPRDRRELMWYMQRPGAKPVYAEGQTYDKKKYNNNLVLRLNESYDGSRLYCAHAYVLYSMSPQGNFYGETSGPTLRSNNITLVQRRKEKNKGHHEGKDENENTQENVRHMAEEGLDGSSSPMVYAIPIGVVALLFVSAAAAWLYRRRRAPESPQDDEYIYARPQVLYATLDLQSPTTEYTSSLAQESSPYAKIIGVYRP